MRRLAAALLTLLFGPPAIPTAPATIRNPERLVYGRALRDR